MQTHCGCGVFYVSHCTGGGLKVVRGSLIVASIVSLGFVSVTEYQTQLRIVSDCYLNRSNVFPEAFLSGQGILSGLRPLTRVFPAYFGRPISNVNQ